MMFIYTKEKAFSEAQCQKIINFIDDSKLSPSHGNFSNYNGLFHIDAHNQEWTPILYEALEEYKKQHPFLHDSCKWRLNSMCNFQKYGPNEYYWSEHCEQGPYPDDYRRMLAWMIYLNSIEKEGGTKFPQQNFTAPARGGDLLIWPAAWTHSHHGTKTAETKYIITGWCSYMEMAR